MSVGVSMNTLNPEISDAQVLAILDKAYACRNIDYRKKYTQSTEIRVLKQNGVGFTAKHSPVSWLRLVQTNFIPEITFLLLLLIERLEFTPCGGKFTSGTDMSFEADTAGERPTVSIERDVFKLIVVYDVRLCSCILIGIELLLTRCAGTCDDSRIDDLELIVFLITPFDEESRVVQLGLR